MARIRTIKPDFWTDERIVELPVEVRLFFIGTWNFADDNGNLPRSPVKLKMQIYPGDVIDCEPLICALIDHGLLREYEVNGHIYLNIVGFQKHQVINRRSKTGLPPPPAPQQPPRVVPRPVPEPDSAAAHEHPRQANSHQHDDEDSCADHGVLTEKDSTCPIQFSDDSEPAHASLTEYSVSDPGVLTDGREGKGRERSKPTSKACGVGPNARAREGPPLAAAGISKTMIGWERERHKAARGITASNQQVIDLAALGVSEGELRKAYDAAVADRLACDDPNPVNAGFVRTFVEKFRRPPRPPRPKRDDWHTTEPGIERKARDLGIAARAGESYPMLKARVWDEISRRQHHGNGATAGATA